MNDASITVPVFHRAFLSGDTGNSDVERTNSASLVVQGNALEALFTVINSSGTSGTVTFQLEGSYDGHEWEEFGNSVAVSSLSTDTLAASLVDRAFVRVRASVSTSGTPTRAVFNGHISFSMQ